MVKRFRLVKENRTDCILKLWLFYMMFFLGLIAVAQSQSTDRPNVILIITDDQGYGDLGITGNPHVMTPVIDAFARKSARFTNFYVSPVCAPTRSSLMTGRYSLRTGIRDTYNGGAMMATNEVTIAEMLKQANYTTGIFGKWHLGDNYPSRPQDQGFDESVIHLSGGMGQVGDFTTWYKGATSYFDPVLWHNGKQRSYKGYCSDIFANEAIDFIARNHDRPFFCYLSFNAPHTPLQVPDAYYAKYKNMDPSSGFKNDDEPFEPMSEKDKEDARKVYAMVTNIDDNMGKLMKKLKELNIVENTLIIFMTDNGPQQVRYKAGMRGRKGSVYRGGVRVPFYLRFPALFKGGKAIKATSAHIDVLPTLSEICNVPLPKNRKIDGKSLLPRLTGKDGAEPNRELFFYWTRKYPERYFNMALQDGPYKLVAHTDYDSDIENFELFNIDKDPFEQENGIVENTAMARRLKSRMDYWYNELTQSKNVQHPPRIIIGSDDGNPTFLNRNDAGGQRGIWDQEEVYGKWDVSIMEGTYHFRFKFIKPIKKGGRLYLETGAIVNQKQHNLDQTDIIEMKSVQLPSMKCDLIPFYRVDDRRIFPFWVEIKKIN